MAKTNITSVIVTKEGVTPITTITPKYPNNTDLAIWIKNKNELIFDFQGNSMGNIDSYTLKLNNGSFYDVTNSLIKQDIVSPEQGLSYILASDFEGTFDTTIQCQGFEVVSTTSSDGVIFLSLFFTEVEVSLTIDKTITTTNDLTLATSGKYCDKNIKISLEETSKANLIAENIKKDVTILGVTGTLEQGGSLTPEDRLSKFLSNELTEIKASDFKDGDTSLDSYIFYDKSSLTSVELKDSIAYIGRYAFYNCSGLTSLRLTTNTTSISEYAFANCSKLEEIICPVTTAPTLPNASNNVFDIDEEGNNITKYIYIPKNSKENYKNSANWAKLLCSDNSPGGSMLLELDSNGNVPTADSEGFVRLYVYKDGYDTPVMDRYVIADETIDLYVHLGGYAPGYTEPFEVSSVTDTITGTTYTANVISHSYVDWYENYAKITLTPSADMNICIKAGRRDEGFDGWD